MLVISFFIYFPWNHYKIKKKDSRGQSQNDMSHKRSQFNETASDDRVMESFKKRIRR